MMIAVRRKKKEKPILNLQTLHKRHIFGGNDNETGLGFQVKAQLIFRNLYQVTKQCSWIWNTSESDFSFTDRFLLDKIVKVKGTAKWF